MKNILEYLPAKFLVLSTMLMLERLATSGKMTSSLGMPVPNLQHCLGKEMEISPGLKSLTIYIQNNTTSISIDLKMKFWNTFQ